MRCFIYNLKMLLKRYDESVGRQTTIEGRNFNRPGFLLIKEILFSLPFLCGFIRESERERERQRKKRSRVPALAVGMHGKRTGTQSQPASSSRRRVRNGRNKKERTRKEKKKKKRGSFSTSSSSFICAAVEERLAGRRIARPPG